MHSLLLSLMLLTLGSVPALGQPAPQSADALIVLPPELARVLTDYEADWTAGDAAALARYLQMTDLFFRQDSRS